MNLFDVDEDFNSILNRVSSSWESLDKEEIKVSILFTSMICRNGKIWLRKSRGSLFRHTKPGSRESIVLSPLQSIVLPVIPETVFWSSNPSFAVHTLFLLLSSVDDGGPESYRSAFTFYAIEQWVESVVKNPSHSRQKILHLLRTQWDQMNKKEKKPYEKMEKNDIDRYVKEMKALYPS